MKNAKLSTAGLFPLNLTLQFFCCHRELKQLPETFRFLVGFSFLGVSCHVAFVCYKPLGLDIKLIKSPLPSCFLIESLPKRVCSCETEVD